MSKLSICIALVFVSAVAAAQVQGGNGQPVTAPGGGNNTLPPGGPNVIIYRDMKYTGMSRALAQGNFDAQQLGFLGSNVSSIYVPPGTTLTAYDRRGSSRTFTASVANLAQYGWDNKIVSGIIRRGNPGNGGSHGGNVGIRPPVPVPPVIQGVAVLYSNPRFRGSIVKFGTGRVPHLGIGADRAASSIHLAPGYAIRVYSGILFTGHYRTFHTSIVNLAQFGWDDAIRSVEIMRL